MRDETNILVMSFGLVCVLSLFAVVFAGISDYREQSHRFEMESQQLVTCEADEGSND